MNGPAPSPAIQQAVDRLLAAGMEYRYRSSTGRSFYLGWPGRRGTVRVSDHRTHKGDADGIYGRLTFSDQWPAPRTEDTWTRLIAAVLGRYLIKAPMEQKDQGHDSIIAAALGTA